MHKNAMMQTQNKVYWHHNASKKLSRFPIHIKKETCDFNKGVLHRQPGIEINIIHAGNGFFSLSGTPLLQSPRSVCIIRGSIPHYFYFSKNETVKRTIIHFDDHQLLNRWSMEGLFSWIPEHTLIQVDLNVDQYVYLEKLCAKLKQELNQSQIGWAEMAMMTLMEMTILIQRICHVQSNIHEGIYSKETIISSCKNYISQHLSEDLSLQYVADLFHISAEHLTRLFKKKTGMSYYQFVQVERIAKAKEMLVQHDDESVTNIAFSVGFNSQSQFCKVFREYENSTPTAYRKQYSPGIGSITSRAEYEARLKE